MQYVGAAAAESRADFEFLYLNRLMDKCFRSFYVKYLLLKRPKVLLGFRRRVRGITTREGIQMRMIKAMVDQFAGGGDS